MQVNKKLLPIKGHFFFFNAGKMKFYLWNFDVDFIFVAALYFRNQYQDCAIEGKQSLIYSFAFKTVTMTLFIKLQFQSL